MLKQDYTIGGVKIKIKTTTDSIVVYEFPNGEKKTVDRKWFNENAKKITNSKLTIDSLFQRSRTVDSTESEAERKDKIKNEKLLAGKAQENARKLIKTEANKGKSFLMGNVNKDSLLERSRAGDALKLNSDVAELRRKLKGYNTGMLQKMSGIKADRETMIRKIVAEKLGK